MRNLKIFGLAFVVVLATSAAGAGAASAAELTAESYPVQVTGSNMTENDKFVSTVGSVNCKTTSYVGTIASATTQVSAAPSFSNCTAFGFPATFDVNGCLFVFNIGTGATGDVDFSCPAGKTMAVTAISAGTTKCTLHIGAQSDIGGNSTYFPAGAGTTREVRISVNLNGIDYSHTKGTGLGSCVAGSATNGTLEASAITTAEVESSNTHVGMFIS